MRLRGHILSNVGPVVERDAILRTNGHVLVEAEPELGVVVVSNLGGRIDNDTLAVVHTNLRRDGSGRRRSSRILLDEETADIVAFHVAVVDHVHPTNLHGLRTEFNFHAENGHVLPVGTLDGVQIGKAEVLHDLLQVDSIGSYALSLFLRDIVVYPSVLRILKQFRCAYVSVPLTTILCSVHQDTRRTISSRDNQLRVR